MPDLFKDVVPSILVTKKSVFETDDYKNYVPFVINKSLSAHYDCIFFVNEMNKNSFLSKKTQYEYYLNTIRPWKRPFQGWLKKDKIEEIEFVKEYFEVSLEKAKAMRSLLSNNDMKKIKEYLQKGG